MDVAASGIDWHPDRTDIYLRLQIQGNRKLMPCFRTFREVFSHPYIGFCVISFCTSLS